MTSPTLRAALLAAALLAPTAAAAQQVVDSAFAPTVARPAYPARHPRVLFDEGHLNFHTSHGRYKPFARLIEADGYVVTPTRERLGARVLAGADVLVIANPRAGLAVEDRYRSAFTDQEADAVRDWVAAGGALLLIVDHAPFGHAGRDLAARFGVQVSGGTTSDSLHHDTVSGSRSFLVFTRENGLLGAHPVLEGRDASERVGRVQSFTGTSLLGPAGSTPLLRLSDAAVDRPPANADTVRAALERARANGAAIGDSAVSVAGITGGGPVSAAGRAQAVAVEHGRGRVVVLGEAAMLSAQLVRRPDGTATQMGMNRPGIDNQRFALNLMHWLTRLLPQEARDN